MVTLFHFKPNHTPQDLQDHWRDMIENPLSDDQDIIGKLKSSQNKFKGNVYHYSEEYEYDFPNSKEIEEIFSAIPSLAAKTLSPEMQTKNIESQNINSLSLHCYFSAERVEKLVSDAFNRVVDDENLRITLHRTFKRNLIDRGRKITVENISRILNDISKMDDATADTECQIIELDFENMLISVQRKLQSGITPRMYDANMQELIDAFNTLKAISSKVTWPANLNAPLAKLRENIIVKTAKLYAYFLFSYCTDPSKIQRYSTFIEAAARNDPNNLLESYAPAHLKAHIAQLKQGFANQPNL